MFCRCNKVSEFSFYPEGIPIHFSKKNAISASPLSVHDDEKKNPLMNNNSPQNYRLLCVNAGTYLRSCRAAGSTTQLISLIYSFQITYLPWSYSIKVISSDVIRTHPVVLSLILIFME